MRIRTLILILLLIIPLVIAADVNITPSNPTTDDDLSCDVGGSVVGVSFNWFINNVFVLNGITLDSSYTDVGDLVRCDAWYFVYDGSYFIGSDDVIIINRDPIVDIPDVVMDEDTIYTIDLGLYVYDPDGDTIVWSVSGTNANFTVSINGDTATLMPAQDWNSQITLTFTASDGNGGFDSDDVLVIVNSVYDPFSFDLPFQFVLDEDTSLVKDLNNYIVNVDNNNLTFTITSINTNLNVVIDPVTYVMTVTPNQDWNGNEDVTVEVTDGITTETDTVNILVNAIDDTPSIISINPNLSNVVLDEGIVQVFSISASDSDTPTLFYTWTLDGAIVLTGSSRYNYNALDGPSNHTLVVRVSDGNTFVENTWTIDENNVNPVADAGGTYVCSLGSGLNLLGIGADVPADVLSYEWDLNNDLVYEINTQQTTFDCNALGSFIVNLQVTDDDMGVGNDSAIISVVSGIVNNPPFFNPPLTDQTGQAWQLFTYDIDAFDPDVGDFLTFSDDTSLFDINPNTGLISFIPVQAGVYNIGITVCDDAGMANSCVTDSFTLTITSGNVPVVTITDPNVDPFTLFFGLDLNLTGEGVDVEDGVLPGMNLTWSEGAVVYGTGNMITISNLNLGQHVITLTGVDSDNNVGTDTITIDVVYAQCSDGIDNDGDGLVDLNDPGCSDSTDNDETDVPVACNDGIDNDGDGLLDYPNDLGCTAAGDGSETENPVAVAGADQIVDVNTQVDFDGGASYDIDGNITDYIWDFGDSTSANGANVSHTYTQDGIYTVTLTVVDNDGLTDIDNLVVTVNSVSGVAGTLEDDFDEHDVTIVSAVMKEEFEPGNKITLVLKVRNEGSNDEVINFDVFISDLLVHEYYSNYFVKKGESKIINLDLTLPKDFDQGNYIIKIVASNRYVSDTKYISVEKEELKSGFVSSYVSAVDKLESKTGGLGVLIILALLIVLTLIGIVIAARALGEEQYWLS